MPGTGILFKISAVVNVALLAVIGILIWRTGALADERDEALMAVGRCAEKLATTAESLDGALGHLDANNARAAENAARLARDREQAAADLAAANARWERSRASVASLEASARNDNQPACEASAAAREALNGL